MKTTPSDSLWRCPSILREWTSEDATTRNSMLAVATRRPRLLITQRRPSGTPLPPASHCEEPSTPPKVRCRARNRAVYVQGCGLDGGLDHGQPSQHPMQRRCVPLATPWRPDAAPVQFNDGGSNRDETVSPNLAEDGLQLDGEGIGLAASSSSHAAVVISCLPRWTAAYPKFT
jgi:hypothetical protein